MLTGVSQQFCVRWNSHLGSLGAAFPELLAGQRFVDVTLACDGHQVRCHRLVLAACSTYFESLLNDNPCKHPIIILPKDVRLWEIQALVDFMYKGQVNVSQAGLPQLLKCAETLQIRGLCGTESTLNEVSAKAERSSNTNAATNLLPNCSSLNFSFATNFAPNCQSEHEQNEQLYNSSSSSSHRAGTSAVDKPSSMQRQRTKSNEHLVKSKKPNANDNITKGISTSGSSLGFAELKRTKPNAIDQHDPTLTHPTELTTEVHIKNEEIDSDENNQDDNMDDDMDQSNSKIQSDHDQPDVVIMHLDNLNHNTSDSCTSKNDLNQSIHVQSHHDFDNDATTDHIHEIVNSSDSESHYTLGHKQQPFASPSSSTLLSIGDSNVSTKLTIDASSTTSSSVASAIDSCTPSSSIPSTSQICGGIRVKPIKNLFVSDQCVVDRSERFHSEVHDLTAVNDLAVTTVIDDDSADPVRNWIESNSQSKPIDDPVYMSSYADDADGNVAFVGDQYLPPSLKFNKNSMSIYVKNTTNDRKNRAAETHISDNSQYYESIICSPNFVQVPFMDNGDVDVDDESDADAPVITPAIAMQAQTIRRLKYMLTKNEADNYHDDHTINIHDYNLSQTQMNDEMIDRSSVDDHVNRSSIDNDDTKDDDDLLLMPMHRKHVTGKRNRKVYGTADELRDINFLKMYQAAAAAAAAKTSKQGKPDNRQATNLMNPLRSAVILRNPRGNQKRTYTTDALYAALMDVKSGESIYKASQVHKVPRKTLRNWMKRWNIKSVFPMPYQLKQAAGRKRQKSAKDNNQSKPQ